MGDAQTVSPPGEDALLLLLPERAGRSRARLRAEYVVGVVLILAVVCLWVGSSALIQYIFEDLSFDRPFFLTFVDNSLFSLYLPTYWVTEWWRGRRRGVAVGVSAAPALSAAGGDDVMSVKETVHLALLLSPLWFALNYTFNLSLDYTNIASTTILSSTSGLWTMLIARVALKEPLAVANIVGVVVTVAGATLVSLRDSDGGDGTSRGHGVWGDALCLLSAVFYGLYTVALKVRARTDDRLNMQLTFGMVGFFNAVLLWPFFLVLHYSGAERFEVPSGRVAGFLVLNGLIGSVVSDLLWARSVLLTSPLMATVGLSLTIPLAMLADYAFHGARFSALYIVGSVAVVVGFLLVNARFREDIARAPAPAGAPSGAAGDQQLQDHRRRNWPSASVQFDSSSSLAVGGDEGRPGVRESPRE